MGWTVVKRKIEISGSFAFGQDLDHRAPTIPILISITTIA